MRPADVTVSTAALSRVLRPSILTRLELSDGRFETFEMSAEQLQVCPHCFIGRKLFPAKPREFNFD